MAKLAHLNSKNWLNNRKYKQIVKQRIMQNLIGLNA